MYPTNMRTGWNLCRIPDLMHGCRVMLELLKLGIEVSQRTVGRLMPKRKKPPSQTWRAFLDNHVEDLVIRVN